MKLPLLLLCGTAALLAAAPAQTTGKNAMRIVARDRGADYLPRMLQLTGENGLPQPPIWRVIARDRQNAVQEFYVSKDAILSEGPIPPFKANGISGTPLPMHRLNIDSSEAFAITERAARTARIGFDRVHYQLRCLELSPNAAWFVTLVDPAGNRVGEVSVGASTGAILTQQWFVQPLSAPVLPPPPPRNFWERLKQGWTHGTQGVRQGVGNSAGWVQRKVTPLPPPPNPYPDAR